MTERGARQELLLGFDELPLKRIIFHQDYYPHRKFSLEIEDKKGPVFVNPEAVGNLLDEFSCRGKDYWDNLIKIQFKKLESASALMFPDRFKNDEGFYSSIVMIDASKYEKDYGDFSKCQGTLLFINHTFLHEWWHLREFIVQNRSTPVIYNEFKAEDFAKERIKQIKSGKKEWQPLIFV